MSDLTSPETAPDPVRAFRDALPDWARQLGVHGDPRAVADIHTAHAAGVDMTVLAADVTFHVRGLDNAEQVMRHRLRQIARPDQDEQQ